MPLRNASRKMAIQQIVQICSDGIKKRQGISIHLNSID